jgi:hypothetical protein
MSHVLGAKIHLSRRYGVAVVDRPGRIRDNGFDPPLERLGELLASAREHLDTVVLERIVRCEMTTPAV